MDAKPIIKTVPPIIREISVGGEVVFRILEISRNKVKIEVKDSLGRHISVENSGRSSHNS